MYQLVEIVNINAIQNKNFDQTSLFFLNHLKSIQNTTLDNKDSATYHLKILLAIANIHFRKKDFKESLNFIKEAKVLIVKYKSELSKHEESILLLKCLNLNFIGKHQTCSQFIDQYLEKTPSLAKSYNLILLRAMVHIQQDETREALKKLNLLNKSDTWVKKNIGFEWLMNKKYMEVIIHIELDNLDLIDSRIKALLRSHKTYFVKNESFQIIPFLKLINEYIKSPQIINSEGFKNKVDNTIISKPNNSEDLFFICFYAWLKAKIIKANTYTTTLELINAS